MKRHIALPSPSGLAAAPSGWPRATKAELAS